MKTVSMLELRQNALQIVESVRRGQRLILTYRGKPMARIEPLEPSGAEDDSFYSLAELAAGEGENLTNREMDDLVYGQ